MTKRKKEKKDPLAQLRCFASLEDINESIKTLNECFFLLRRFRSQSVRHDDPDIRDLELSVRNAASSTFYRNSSLYRQFAEFTLSQPQLPPNADASRNSVPRNNNQERFRRTLTKTANTISGWHKHLTGKWMEMASDQEQRARVAFEHLKLHSSLPFPIATMFKDRHYREAVLKASIALVDSVKMRSGRHNLDGVALMSTVFSPNDPILAFNSLANQTDKDEQQGLMHLFMGAVLGIRNPRAHAL
jgi:uncharacterized protein (TIGR02391 family)